MKSVIFLSVFLFSGFSYAKLCPDSFDNKKHRVEWLCDSEKKEKRTFDSQTDELLEIDYFDTDERPYQRDVFKTRFGLTGKYIFSYLSENQSNFKFSKIEFFNFNNELIAVHNANISEIEIEQSISDTSLMPPKALIIDSGFNFSHPWVFGKHYVNDAEVVDGKDNDEDGLIDNLTTFNGEQAAGGSINYKFNLNQLIQLPTHGAPFSHGGFVASVAMKDVESMSYLGAGGDIHSAVYLYRLLNQITRYDIRFTNMSFGFGDKNGLSIVDSESIEAIEGIMRASFKTLHVVASGNSSRNFDKMKFSEYPACINLRNKITVGALDTDNIVETDLANYKAADFSNIGYRCVDIMAPGVEMLGAGLGETFMKASGTSVASPFVLNVLLKMHEINPDLGQRDLREILLKTSYVPKEKPFEVKSGGAVFPRRALLASQLKTTEITAEEAVWKAREELNLKGELLEKEKLNLLWKQRRL